MKPNPKLEVLPLNEIGSLVRPKSYAAGNAGFILKHLDSFLRSTSAPPSRRARGKDYRLDQRPQVATMSAKSGERRLEATLFDRYGPETSATFLPSVPRLAAFQVPLYSEQSKQGWGSIDLVGQNKADAYPVAIELKIEKENDVEPPLRALIEALAYMVALRDAALWRDFAPEWQACLGHSKPLPCPTHLSAVVIGTEGYWDKIRDDRLQREGLTPLGQLAEACSKRGFDFHWASVRASGQEQAGAWKLLEGVREVSLSEFAA